MKIFENFFLLIIISIITLEPAFGQPNNYFIAGDNAGVIYYDIEPDVSLEIPPYSGWIYKIDINLDGTNDFAIKINYSVGVSHDISDIYVTSYGSNKVAYGYKAPFMFQGDTIALFNMGIGLNEGDTIDDNINFYEGDVHLKSDWWQLGASIYSSWISGDYIPTCMMENGIPDCIYGWIKVSNVTFSNITIESFAANIPLTTSIKSQTIRDISILPNPCSGSVKVQFENSGLGSICLDLFEISGIKIMSIMNEIKMPETYEIELDLSDLTKGVYFFVLKSNKGMQTKKIIKL